MIFENLPSTNTPVNAANLNKGIILTGFIQMYAGSTSPAGWLMCDGSAVSRTTYADLYAVIGTTYGSGDGSTTFNLPNLKGKVAVGKDSNDSSFDTLGETGGEKTHTLTVDELPAHVPKTSSNFNVAAAKFLYEQDAQNGAFTIGTTGYPIENFGTIGNNQAHNILQPYIVLNYIIKT